MSDSMLNVIIGIIAIVIAVIGALITYMQLTQNRKSLNYEIQAITPVFTIAKGLNEQLEIRLNGEVVNDANIVIIKFTNNGKTSIKPDDYVTPITVSFENGKIINANIIKAEPPDLEKIIASQEINMISFNKILLNSKDEFVLQMLLSDFHGKDEDIKIKARIEGIKQINSKPKVDKKILATLDNPIFQALAFAPWLVLLYLLLTSLLRP